MSRWHDYLTIKRGFQISQLATPSDCYIFFDSFCIAGPIREFSDAVKIANSRLSEVKEEIDRKFEEEVLNESRQCKVE